MSQLNDSRRWQFTMIYGVLLFLSLKMASGMFAAILFEVLTSAGFSDAISDWTGVVLAIIICVVLAYYDSKGTTKKVLENPDRIKMLTYQMAGVFVGVCFLAVNSFVITTVFHWNSSPEFITSKIEIETSMIQLEDLKYVLSGAETVLILLAIGIRK